jgi:hypothetical protein
MKTSKPDCNKRDQRPIARRLTCPREALITDPAALLEALAKAQQPVEARHTPPPAPVLPPPPTLELVRPTPVSLPFLHENERVAHAPSSGTVVIIRRRRAA